MFFYHRQKQKIDTKDLKINCDNNKIMFIKETKILGVMIDQDLSFKSQVTFVCKKANSKASLIAKSIYLFSDSFKPTLFKIFIQPQFDYCSTLIQYISNKSFTDKLNNCYAKAINRITDTNINNLTLEEQYHKLSKYGILPLSYRLFFRFCTFVINVINNNKLEISQEIVLNVKSTRSDYTMPIYIRNVKKFSFIVIATKILNLFLTDEINVHKGEKTKEKLKKSLLDKIIDRYNKSEQFWKND